MKKSKASKNKLKHIHRQMEMSRYYDEAADLSYRITKWSLKHQPPHRFVVCSGGGPGIMEAANLGAKKAGGKSIGLNISLPFEQRPNQHITDELSFEFHYFFMRKFWFAYLAKALVIFPGGYGTLDELFEILTLVQTTKIRKKMPVVIYDKKYWQKIINFNGLVESGMIDESDLRLFKFAETVDEAFEYIKSELSKHYLVIKESLFNIKTK